MRRTSGKRKKPRDFGDEPVHGARLEHSPLMCNASVERLEQASITPPVGRRDDTAGQLKPVARQADQQEAAISRDMRVEVFGVGIDG